MWKITEAAQRKSKATDEAYFQKTKELVQNVPHIVIGVRLCPFLLLSWGFALVLSSPTPLTEKQNRTYSYGQETWFILPEDKLAQSFAWNELLWDPSIALYLWANVINQVAQVLIQFQPLLEL